MASLNTKFWRSVAFVPAVVALGLLTVTPDADARVGGGKSFGSRGDRTFTAPPTTNTAPKAAAPMERSMTQPGKQTAGQTTPSAGAAQTAASQSRFGGMGMRSLLMGGLLAAGLAGIFGVGALASVLGFMLQMALIAGVIWLIMSFIRSRRSAQPAMATASASPAGQTREQMNFRQAMGGGSGGPANVPLAVKPEDFQSFERLLTEVQDAYGRADLDALGDRVTPEMLSYFAEQLDGNAKQGVRNETGEVKLLQGDLAEAWRENSIDFATVAMRYSIYDVTIEGSTGRVVSGNKNEPQEVTELWTFRRPMGATASQWELSAIQQA